MGFIRRTIIVLAEVLSLILIVIFTVLGVAYGTGIATQINNFSGADFMQIDHARKVGMWLGGFGGFAIGIMLTAIFFALAEIARNTRPQVV